MIDNKSDTDAFGAYTDAFAALSQAFIQSSGCSNSYEEFDYFCVFLNFLLKALNTHTQCSYSRLTYSLVDLIHYTID